MHIEIRKVTTSQDYRTIMQIDRETFPAADCWSMEQWEEYHAYALFLNHAPIGSVAFSHDLGWDNRRGAYVTQKGTLFICTTAIHPAHQGHGWGRFLKSWEIAYAKVGGFSVIQTCSRESNTKMLALNKKHGFTVVGRIPELYARPTEDAVRMELLLNKTAT